MPHVLSILSYDVYLSIYLSIYLRKAKWPVLARTTSLVQSLFDGKPNPDVVATAPRADRRPGPPQWLNAVHSCRMPDSKALAKVRADAEGMKAEAERMLSVASDADQREKAAAKIQAHFRGQRDRALVEVKKVQAELKHRSKADRDLMFAMASQNSLANLTDVKAMTAVPQHVQRAPRRLGRLISNLTLASLARACG